MPAQNSAFNPPFGGYPASLGMGWAAAQTTQVPMMVGIPTETPTDYILNIQTNGLHPDDASGLAQLYPFTAIQGGKLPLINRTATIEGFVTDKNGVRLFGANVYVVPHVAGTAQVTPAPPSNGKISGTARLAPNSVVGARNTVTQALTSGEFRIEGIPMLPGAFAQLDVIAESLECAGFPTPPWTPPMPTNTPGTRPLWEWFYDQVLNPSVNLIPSQPVSACQTARFSNDAALPIGSLAVTQGSVISLYSNLQFGTPQSAEKVSRPVVEVLPRAALPTTNVTINVHSNSNPINTPLVVGMNANGATVPVGTPVSVGPSAVFPGAFVSTYLVPAALLPPPPIHVVVKAQETTPPYPYPAASGVNVVYY